jgi:recombination protein RecA
MAKKQTVLEGDYVSASFILDNPSDIIKVSPAFDLATGGGVPKGIIAIFQGKPKEGKTTLALQIAARAQQQYGSPVIYDDIEERLEAKTLKAVPELDTSDNMFKVIQSRKGDILSTDKHLDRLEKALNEFPGCIVIADSFSALSSAGEKTNDYGGGYGNLESRKMEGMFSRRIKPILRVNGCTILGIAHVMQNMNTPGSSVKVSDALKYFLDMRVSLKKAFPNGDWKVGEKIVGQRVQMDCHTSALGAPHGSCNLWLRFGQGYVKEAEIAELASDLSIIEKGGAWYSNEKYEIKAQGFDKLVQALQDNPEAYEGILSEVMAIMQ